MIPVDKQLNLELLIPAHAPALFEIIEQGRDTLRKFLPWVDDTRRLEDYLRFIHACQRQHRRAEALTYTLLWNGTPVGGLGLQRLDQQNKSASLGYWLAPHCQGKGLMTRACQALLQHSFTILQLHRLELRAATENTKSQAVAVRLGFKSEGILRDAERINGRYLDLYIYALLQPQWGKTRGH